MPAEPQVLRIGDWRVDPELDELSREGQTIRVEPRTVQLCGGGLNAAATAGAWGLLRRAAEPAASNTGR